MPLSDDELKNRLRTQVREFRGQSKAPYIDRRNARIREAIALERGESSAEPIRHIITELWDGTPVFFEKPGKEAEQESGNPHDMLPGVGNYYEGAPFEDIWAYLSRAALIDFFAFKCLLVLIYRSAYLLDHGKTVGKFNYRPGQRILTTLEERIGNAFPGGVISLLQFVDLLGWNEDVKYHHDDSYDEFKSNFKRGRVNTLMTCIGVSYEFGSFVQGVVEHAGEPHEIPVEDGLQTMQSLSISRGVYSVSNTDLLEWLSPMLHT